MYGLLYSNFMFTLDTVVDHMLGVYQIFKSLHHLTDRETHATDLHSVLTVLNIVLAVRTKVFLYV